MPLSDDEWSALARGLRRAAARVAPGWTDASTHDPGVTVLQLLAYALEDLAYRNARLSGDARAIARKVAEHASAIAARDGVDASVPARRSDGALVRPRFVAGQLLTADDLQAEQDYVRERIDRRNRALAGAGIVDGLAVTVDDDGGGAEVVVVAPGLAFDGFGREIFVGCAARVALRAAGTTLVVCVGYCERVERLAGAGTGGVANGDGDAAAPANRIVETFELALAAAPTGDALPIARLRRVRGRWRIDPRFRAPRVGR